MNVELQLVLTITTIARQSTLYTSTEDTFHVKKMQGKIMIVVASFFLE